MRGHGDASPHLLVVAAAVAAVALSDTVAAPRTGRHRANAAEPAAWRQGEERAKTDHEKRKLASKDAPSSDRRRRPADLRRGAAFDLVRGQNQGRLRSGVIADPATKKLVEWMVLRRGGRRRVQPLRRPS
jgi:hypothetical protein